MLSELTLSLIALGGVFMAGLSLHSVWQARRAAPRRPDPNPPMHREPVLQTPERVSQPVGHHEPSMSFAPLTPASQTTLPSTERKGFSEPSQAPISGVVGQDHEPAQGKLAPLASPTDTQAPALGSREGVLADGAEAEGRHEPEGVSQETLADAVDSGVAAEAGLDVPPVAPKIQRFVARIDGLVDAIVPIALDGPTSGEALLAHMPSTRRAGTKPFLIEALNEDTREWEHPASGQRYTELQAAIQLANRHGALNEIEYSEFVQKVETLAQAVGGLADVPDMLDVVARARELDTFAGQHDAQLAIHLRARAIAWSVGYIQQCAARHGYLGLISGRMALPSVEEGAPPVLTLQFDAQAALAEDPNQAALRTLTIHFDVPQTDASAQPFEQWHRGARALAETMDAHLVDDFGRVLTDEDLSGIEQQLQLLYKALEERGVPAGSMAARRLFS